MIDWTIFKLLSWTDSYFKDHCIDSPRLTAEILLGFCLKISRLDLYLQHDRPLEKEELFRFKELIRRRIQKEPVGYIIGEKGFYESDFRVSPGVLIPRPDTEVLVETAIQLLDRFSGKKKNVLELGVGSGAIVVSLAKACPENEFFASDISGLALGNAAQNADDILDSSVRFFQGSWFAPLKKENFFDLIVSNPPYIATRDIENLAPEIKFYEPSLALDGGAGGLDCLEQILREAFDYLVPGGSLLLEMGFDQKDGVDAIVQTLEGFGPPKFIRDLAGNNRLVLIKK